MYDRVSIEDLVSFDSFPSEVSLAVQQAVLKHPRGRAALYACSRLELPVWDALWAERPAAGPAELLAGRPLDAERALRVLEQDSRVGVLCSLLASNQLTEAQLSTLASDPPARLIPFLLDQDNLDAHERKALLRRRPASELAEAMLFCAGMFDDDEVVGFLADLPRQGWFSYSYRSLVVQALLFSRPAVLDWATETSPVGQTPATAAASSPRLSCCQAHTLAFRFTESADSAVQSKYALMALVNNPVVDASLVGAVLDRVGELAVEGLSSDEREALDEIRSSSSKRLDRTVHQAFHATACDEESLSWLLRRAAPRDYPTRPLEVILLLENPHVPPADVENLARRLAYDLSVRWAPLAGARATAAVQAAGYWVTGEAHVPEVPLRHTRELPPARAALLETAGRALGDDPQKWETLVSLMDDFSSSFHALVDASAQL